jgi:hypothetical protein
MDDADLQTCPAGTALEGVAVPDTDNDPNTFPTICNLPDLEVCPTGTEQAGHYVKGDGDPSTTNDITPLCSLPEAEVEVCAAGTQLAGIIVQDKDDNIDGNEPACNPFEICPANTVLEGVLVTDDDNDPTTTPNACDLDTLAGILQNCIAFYLSLGNGAARSGAIISMVEGWQALVNGPTIPGDNVGTYPALEELDEADGNDNNDIVISNCNNNDPSGCPSDAQLADIIIQLRTAGYTFTQIENAALNGGTSPPSGNTPEVIEGIFNCIDERDPDLFSLSLSSSAFTQHDTTKLMSQSTENTKNIKDPKISDQNKQKQAQTTSLQETSMTTTVKAEPEIPVKAELGISTISPMVTEMQQNKQQKGSIISQEQMHQQQILKLKQFLKSGQ